MAVLPFARKRDEQRKARRLKLVMRIRVRNDWGRADIAQTRDVSKAGLCFLSSLRYNVDDSRVHQSIDKLVQRSPSTGRWLDAGVPAARARADRAERYVVMLPKSDIVIVTPPSASAHALSLGDQSLELPPAASGEILHVKVATPWRVFIGLPFSLPKSITLAEVTLRPTPQGGVRISLLLVDASAHQARQNAEFLAGAIRGQPIVLALRLAGGPLRVDLQAKGSEIHGDLELSPGHVAMVLDLADSFVDQLAARRAATRRRPLEDAGVAAAEADASSTTRTLPDSGAASSSMVQTRGAGVGLGVRD